MNKADLVNAVKKVVCTKKEACSAVDTVLESIKKALKKGEAVSLVGFGTFKVNTRKARTGRNPKTGETIQIPAKKVPVFRAGAELRKAVK